MGHIPYRADIDGLRAISVCAVLLFHFGHLPQGYLGVDIFFVISGYLMAKVILQDLVAGRFTAGSFYERRFRRIVPLVTFVTVVTVVVGYLTMLPDDLENLAQSAIATAFFANNVLQAITTKNYWDVINEYKPLLHTWSLGVEEQFYIVFPFVFLLGQRFRLLDVRWVLVGVLGVSLALFFSEATPSDRFYWLPFRLWELLAGALVAFKWPFLVGATQRWAELSDSTKQAVASALLLCLLLILGLRETVITSTLAQLAAVFLAVPIVSGGLPVLRPLSSPVVLWIGKRSFGIYMWHQPVLAFARYVYFEELRIPHLVVVTVLSVLLAEVTYRFIEGPFRNRLRIRLRAMAGVTLTMTVVTVIVSGYIYLVGGVVRDVPELELVRGAAGRNIHASYNHAVYDLDRDFDADSRIKVLAIGNSYARDWVNVLRESRFSERLDISYVFVGDFDRIDPTNAKRISTRQGKSDLVFASSLTPAQAKHMSLDLSRLFVVGHKSFGSSNGIYYNRSGADYFAQRARPDAREIALNELRRQQWGGHYLDYFDLILDAQQKVPVFTSSETFISQDTRHLTRAGARYFAERFAGRLDLLFADLSQAKGLLHESQTEPLN